MLWDLILLYYGPEYIEPYHHDPCTPPWYVLPRYGVKDIGMSLYLYITLRTKMQYHAYLRYHLGNSYTSLVYLIFSNAHFFMRY